MPGSLEEFRAIVRPPQTAGLAGQIAGGQVSTAFVFIGGNDFIHAFTGPKCDAPAPTEHQSEAIAIDPDGHGYITTSEGANAPIWHVAT